MCNYVIFGNYWSIPSAVVCLCVLRGVAWRGGRCVSCLSTCPDCVNRNSGELVKRVLGPPPFPTRNPIRRFFRAAIILSAWQPCCFFFSPSVIVFGAGVLEGCSVG